MVTALVAYGSLMGSTAEIAEAVADVLRGAGLTVDLAAAADAPPPQGYDGVVIGSAVYVGRWRPEVRRYLRRHRRALAERPVWLFQSGPCGGEETRRERPSPRIRRLAAAIGAADPTVFGGNLDPARAVGRMSRWVSQSDLAGDYRDFDAIRAWAGDIALRLDPSVHGSVAPPEQPG